MCKRQGESQQRKNRGAYVEGVEAAAVYLQNPAGDVVEEVAVVRLGVKLNGVCVCGFDENVK